MRVKFTFLYEPKTPDFIIDDFPCRINENDTFYMSNFENQNIPYFAYAKAEVVYFEKDEQGILQVVKLGTVK